MAVFALNVMPYISASIIVQLMGSIYPPWEKLRKEEGGVGPDEEDPEVQPAQGLVVLHAGDLLEPVVEAGEYAEDGPERQHVVEVREAGRRQLNQYTRYLTLVLSLVQAFGIAVGLQNAEGLVAAPGASFIVSTVVTLTAGSMLLMWIGEQITSRGIGNGMSLLILAGIVAVLPRSASQMLSLMKAGSMSGTTAAAILGGIAAFVVAIVFIELSQRRLLVQYPRRHSGARAFGGESSFLPLKINVSGVIPPIFASSLLLLPTTVFGFIGSTFQGREPAWVSTMLAQLQHGRPVFMALYGAMIIFFTFFYTSIVFNPQDTADNLRKFGGFLPGVRPGRQTAQYLDAVLTRLTVIGAAYITIVCLLPEALIGAYDLPFYVGGTSLLIVVVVAIDLINQIQSHLVAHQYEALISKSRLKTRAFRSAPAEVEHVRARRRP